MAKKYLPNLQGQKECLEDKRLVITLSSYNYPAKKNKKRIKTVSYLFILDSIFCSY